MPRAMAVTNTVFNRPTKGRAVMASAGRSQRAGITSSKPKTLPKRKPKMVEQNPQQEKPLSHVSEHEAEKEGIGDGDQKCRIKFIVGREAIHLHKHLKGPQERRILQPGRRRAGYMLPAVLDDEEGGGVLLQLLLEGPGVGLSGPAA